jgi:hypothetical protein
MLPEPAAAMAAAVAVATVMAASATTLATGTPRFPDDVKAALSPPEVRIFNDSELERDDLELEFTAFAEHKDKLGRALTGTPSTFPPETLWAVTLACSPCCTANAALPKRSIPGLPRVPLSLGARKRREASRHQVRINQQYAPRRQDHPVPPKAASEGPRQTTRSRTLAAAAIQ